MDDVQPDGNSKHAGFVILISRSVARREFNAIEWTVIVITRCVTLAKLGVAELGVKMSPQPHEAFQRGMKPVNEEVSHPNDKQCLPTDGEQEKATCVNQYVNEARNGALTFV